VTFITEKWVVGAAPIRRREGFGSLTDGLYARMLSLYQVRQGVKAVLQALWFGSG